MKEKRAKKILLVDDEVGFAELLRDLLTIDGYVVELAQNGEDGLEKLKTFQPDAIISDIMMPKMNGFEMFKKVKGCPSTSDIPFLFITGFSDSHMLQEARSIGIFGILTKPIDIEQIEQRLSELINK